MSLACLPTLLLQLLVAAGEVGEGEGGVAVRDSLHDCIVDEGVLLLGGKGIGGGGKEGGKGEARESSLSCLLNNVQDTLQQ